LVENSKLRLGSAKPVGDEEVTPGEIFGFELLGGTTRWVTEKAARGKKNTKYRIRTRTAVMGVRGTDFMAVFSALLAESEIVVFDGEVTFQNRSKPKDRKAVGWGQWGGIGGRFGGGIGKL